MSYPSELLPRNIYKSKIDLDPLLERHPLAYLLRKSADNTNPNDVKVRDIFPRKEDLFGFSTYIYGKFKKAHIKFKTKTRAYWKNGDNCPKSSEVNYTIESVSVIPLYITIKDCHMVELPIRKVVKKRTETVITNIYVEHRPMVDNYWHFEFVVRSQDGLEITPDNVKDFHKRSAMEFAEEYIVNIIKTIDPRPIDLSRELYVINPTLTDKLLSYWKKFEEKILHAYDKVTREFYHRFIDS